ncbi:MAG TPA: hypothetical protein VFP55_14880 [Solirubrobacteraceae bacterium]|nr:hypothetical protein [Solirubrobacteraceae bacterium]
MHLVFASGILGMGQSPSSLGQTLALLITFLGIGVLVNGLVVYIVAQVIIERRQNQERQRNPQAEPPGGISSAL